ncbi:hypothetical protein ABEB36_013595 [Hypothenemus hampei]|uniref:MYND-type domain-containing protein n=1 Tax=Hypothenemus hampei TaxID=57062 RepID=A0ABD1E4P0_HYPHA
MAVNNGFLPRGTTIHQEQPFVYILSSKNQKECCDFCFKRWTDLFKCSSCKYVYYCDKKCQKLAWTTHKQECKPLKRIYPRILPDAARMLFRLLKKLQNGGITYKSYYSKKDYRMWKDLMSHYSELKNDSRRMEHVTSLYAVLTDFMQDEQLPNFVEFTGLYGRMSVNSFTICNQELQSLGTGIYLAASIIDHSCQPNALAIFEGTTLIIRTIDDMPKLDWSTIKICYIDTLASTQERQNELFETYYFLCDCPKCSKSENMSEMFGAVCPNESCDNSVPITRNEISKCSKCEKQLTQDYIDRFHEVIEFTDMHLSLMKNTTYLDVCKICLKKQKGLLYKYNLKHIKTQDLAFDACINLNDFDTALVYGIELTESYGKYLPSIHPLTGLLYLKLCKILMYKNKPKDAIVYLRKATDILKITHSTASSLYKTEVWPLIEQCKFSFNKN